MHRAKACACLPCSKPSLWFLSRDSMDRFHCSFHIFSAFACVRGQTTWPQIDLWCVNPQSIPALLQDCLSASCIRLYAPNILTCNILNTSTLSIQLVSDEYFRLSKFLKIQHDLLAAAAGTEQQFSNSRCMGCHSCTELPHIRHRSKLNHQRDHQPVPAVWQAHLDHRDCFRGWFVHGGQCGSHGGLCALGQLPVLD